MSKQKKPKPTLKEVNKTVDQMMQNMNWFKNNMDMVGRLFDLYVEFKTDNEGFKEFLEKRQNDYLERQKKEEADGQTEDGQTNDQDSGQSSKDEE